MTKPKPKPTPPAKRPVAPDRGAPAESQPPPPRSVTHIKDLVSDPHNAMTHTPRNLGMLSDSLQEVGAARSIVIDEHNVILAGNGTIDAAATAGITKVQVVDADGETIIAVRRSNLTDIQKARLALLDNRTAQLAEWNVEALKELAATGVPLTNLWTTKELSVLLEAAALEKEREDEPPLSAAPAQFIVIVTCRDEEHQKELLEQLMGEGVACRAVVS